MIGGKYFPLIFLFKIVQGVPLNTMEVYVYFYSILFYVGV